MPHANATSGDRDQRLPLGDSVLLVSGLTVLSWALPVGGFWLVWRLFT